jgi:uncharacterized protein YwqG
MGFWDKIFGKKMPDKGEPSHSANLNLTKAELLAPTDVAAGLVLPKAIALEWPSIKKAELDIIAITATRDDNPGLRQSKFGHYPCLPKGYEYPRDNEGNYLYPLAQLNLAEMPRLKGYPESGYLQFYIGTSDCYGLSFDDTPSSFAVLYFEEHELDDIETDFSFLGDILQTDYTPVHYPHTLSFATKKEYISTNDHLSEANTALALEHMTGKYPQVASELEDFFYENFDCHGHKLGGYAYFTQYDIRAENEKIEDYVLLFQMDSDDDIMWGDSGVGNFFIHPEKLAQRDFSEVIYTWDCS